MTLICGKMRHWKSLNRCVPQTTSTLRWYTQQTVIIIIKKNSRKLQSLVRGCDYDAFHYNQRSEYITFSEASGCGLTRHSNSTLYSSNLSKHANRALITYGFLTTTPTGTDRTGTCRNAPARESPLGKGGQFHYDYGAMPPGMCDWMRGTVFVRRLQMLTLATIRLYSNEEWPKQPTWRYI